jgi:hypothetical protein
MTTTTVADELWRSQRDALQDLAAFIDEHSPDAERPLPLLHWSVGPSRTVHAQVHAFDREHGGGCRDPRAVVTAYADVFSTAIVEHEHDDKALLAVRGRIGPPDSIDDDAGRTRLAITAKVPIDLNRKVGGRAFLP